MCASRLVEEHRQADKAMTLNRGRNRKGPDNRDCTTPQHDLCRGHIRKVTRSRDVATTPLVSSTKLQVKIKHGMVLDNENKTTFHMEIFVIC